MTMFRFSLRQQAFACSLFAVLLCLPLAQAGPGLWTSSGPEAGNVFDLVASPDSANVFYAIGNGGVYKTVNGGVTWTEANAGLNRRVFALEHSQTAPNRLYVAGSRKLYFSNDAALSWQDRTPPPVTLPRTMASSSSRAARNDCAKCSSPTAWKWNKRWLLTAAAAGRCRHQPQTITIGSGNCGNLN